jgi:hypothetical protein
VIQKGAKTKAIEPGIGEQNQAQTMLPEVKFGTDSIRHTARIPPFGQTNPQFNCKDF